ncbi:MAG: hypothetical protein IT374_27755, partial [Polyangiaceae bacterium]|nr:hypothetical protein [Polyangiaceae bacterium]
MLITQGSRDIGKAIVPPASGAHPRAMATLLEGLSLFLHEPLYTRATVITDIS